MQHIHVEQIQLKGHPAEECYRITDFWNLRQKDDIAPMRIIVGPTDISVSCHVMMIRKVETIIAAI